MGVDTELSYELKQTISSPFRPRNLKLAGARPPALITSADYTLDLTWVSSNRTEFAKEDDAAQTPEETEEYDIEITRIDGTSLFTDSNITSPFTIDFTTMPSLGEIRLWSRRTSDGRLSPKYAFLEFTVDRDEILLSGDAQSGGDRVLLEGDMQSTGTDTLDVSGA